MVKGSGGSRQEAQATISLNSAETSETLRTALDRGCKVAVYGVNFDFNKATLRKDAETVLQQILALFKDDANLTAEIGGHTDNVGTPAYNLTLSGARAVAVKAWLVAHGVAASRLTTRGYGDTVLVVPNDSDANRAKNRRVELKKPNCDR
jgi:outer membrane protein OmpA-like peptidoglycan-associated protein